MKLATLKDGSRNGQLIVVARDLKTACIAHDIAPTLQAALDDWGFISPQLEALYQKLNSGKAAHSFDFKADACMSPLPRAYRKVTAQTYPAYAERVSGGQVSVGKEGLPVLTESRADFLRPPTEDVLLLSEQSDLDFSAEILVLTGDLPQGSSNAAAFEQIRLIGLSCQWRLHAAALRDTPHSALADAGTTLAPVLVSPEELGEYWREGKLGLQVRIAWNGNLIGQPDAGGMAFSFPQLMSFLSLHSPVVNGTMISGGVITDKQTSRGVGCLTEKRALEFAATGEYRSSYLRHGDLLKIEMLDKAGKSVFGAIDTGIVESL